MRNKNTAGKEALRLSVFMPDLDASAQSRHDRYIGPQYDLSLIVSATREEDNPLGQRGMEQYELYMHNEVKPGGTLIADSRAIIRDIRNLSTFGDLGETPENDKIIIGAALRWASAAPGRQIIADPGSRATLEETIEHEGTVIADMRNLHITMLADVPAFAFSTDFTVRMLSGNYIKNADYIDVAAGPIPAIGSWIKLQSNGIDPANADSGASAQQYRVSEWARVAVKSTPTRIYLERPLKYIEAVTIVDNPGGDEAIVPAYTTLLNARFFTPSQHTLDWLGATVTYETGHEGAWSAPAMTVTGYIEPRIEDLQVQKFYGDAVHFIGCARPELFRPKMVDSQLLEDAADEGYGVCLTACHEPFIVDGVFAKCQRAVGSAAVKTAVNATDILSAFGSGRNVSGVIRNCLAQVNNNLEPFFLGSDCDDFLIAHPITEHAQVGSFKLLGRNTRVTDPVIFAGNGAFTTETADDGIGDEYTAGKAARFLASTTIENSHIEIKPDGVSATLPVFSSRDAFLGLSGDHKIRSTHDLLFDVGGSTVVGGDIDFEVVNFGGTESFMAVTGSIPIQVRESDLAAFIPSTFTIAQRGAISMKMADTTSTQACLIDSQPNTDIVIYGQLRAFFPDTTTDLMNIGNTISTKEPGMIILGIEGADWTGFDFGLTGRELNIFTTTQGVSHGVPKHGVYSSYAVLEDTRVSASQVTVSHFGGINSDEVITYYRDAGGTDLITADGAEWTRTAPDDRIVPYEYDDIAEMIAATALIPNSTVRVRRGYNQQPELFFIDAPATFTANGTTVVNLVGSTGQGISLRRHYLTRDELFDDPRDAAWFAANPAVDAEDTRFSVLGFNEYDMLLTGATDEDVTNAGGIKLRVLKNAGAFHTRAFGDDLAGMQRAFEVANSYAYTGLASHIQHPGATVVCDDGEWDFAGIATPIIVMCHVRNNGAKVVVPAAYAGQAWQLGTIEDGELLCNANMDMPDTNKPTGTFPMVGTAFRIANMNTGRVWFARSDYFEWAYHFGGNNNQGTVYCDFFMGQVGYCKHIIHIVPENGGWCNTNAFHNGNFRLGGVRVTGNFHVWIDGTANAVVGNTFFNSCYEGEGAEYMIAMKRAFYNTWISPYFETGAVAQAVTIVGDTFVRAGHGLIVGDMLNFAATGVPGGMFELVDYYVVEVPTVDSFKIAVNKGGAVLTPSSAGTSVTYFRQARCLFDGTFCFDNRFVNAFIPFSGSIDFIHINGAYNNGEDKSSSINRTTDTPNEEPIFRGRLRAATAGSRPVFAAYLAARDPASEPHLWAYALGDRGLVAKSSAGAEVARFYANNLGYPLFETMDNGIAYELFWGQKVGLMTVPALTPAIPAQDRALITFSALAGITAAANDQIIINPFGSLIAGIAIGWARMNASNSMIVCFVNYSAAPVDISGQILNACVVRR